jgi:hypothetical protein
MLVAGLSATAASVSPPTVDGVIEPKEWSGVGNFSSQRELLT